MGGIFALVAFKIFVWDNVQKTNVERDAKTKELKSENQKLQAVVTGLKGKAARENENRKALKEVIGDAAFILVPKVDNSLVVARDIVIQWAKQCGIEPPRVTQARPAKVPQSKKTEKHLFTPYTVRVTMKAGAHDLRRFLNVLKADNPYCRIEQMKVSVNHRSKEQHSITLLLTWPSWNKGQHVDLILKELGLTRREETGV